MSSRRNRPNRRRLIEAGSFVAPWFVGFVLLIVYPFCASLYWSFCRYDLLSSPQFIGTSNYSRLIDELGAGDRFGLAVWNTVYYAVVGVPLSIILGIGLAVMLTWPVRGRALFRAIFFLPSVVPVVAASVLWMWLLDPRDGLINYGLSLVGLPGPGWFNSVREAASPLAWFAGTAGFGSKDGLILISLWGVGNFMIIYLAALGDVPQSLYEAAELDGAGRFRRLVHVTLPMLSPVIFFNLIMGLIQSVQAFTQIYIVSDGQGAPAGSALVLSLHLFLSAFKELDMGYASAVAWMMFAMILLATIALFRTSKHWVHYQGLKP